MPRRRVPNKRKINPDPKFQDRLVAKFMNDLMRKGKKSTAEQVVYGAFALIEERAKEEPLKVFKRALDNVKPVLEVKSRRVGGATYQVPVEVPQDRRVATGLPRNHPCGQGPGRNTEKRNPPRADPGKAVKKREDTHKMAEANKAFAHYRW